MMNEKQKEQILQVLSQENHNLHYLIPYEYFLDAKDNFTEFNCQRQEGKEEFLPAVWRLKELDHGCQVFADVWGILPKSLKESDHGCPISEEQWIYSESLIIFSSLSLEQVEDCFAVLMENYWYPSEIGTDENSLECWRIAEEALPVFKFSPVTIKPDHIYYCWWD